MSKVLGIIPARMSSTRLPNKPLSMLDGISMIERVYHQAKKVQNIDQIIIATDSPILYNHASTFAEVIMTSSEHNNGTERCFEALTKTNENYDFVINIQGDEPFVSPEAIFTLVEGLKKYKASIATLVKETTNKAEKNLDSIVKVVVNKNNNALYFSRCPIPFERSKANNFLKHIGIYGFEVDTLSNLVKLAPTQNESIESLEQLRWLDNGYSILCIHTDYEAVSVDTANDLERLKAKGYITDYKLPLV